MSISRWLHDFLVTPLAQANADARAFADSPAGRRFDLKAFSVLVSAAFLLTVQHYLFLPGYFADLAGLLRAVGLAAPADWLLEALGPQPPGRLARLGYWVAGAVLCYVVGPALLIKLVLRERLRDYGVKVGGALRDGWVYGAMFVVMVPLVWAASLRPAFLATYPFYRLQPGEPLWPLFWGWDIEARRHKRGEEIALWQRLICLGVVEFERPICGEHQKRCARECCFRHCR